MASVTFKRGTRAEIEATAKQDGQILMETDQNKKNKMYIDLPDGSRVLIGNSGEAIDTSYDNTTSGLDATNVQNAIDELDSTVDTLNSNLSNKIISGYYNYGNVSPNSEFSIKIPLSLPNSNYIPIFNIFCGYGYGGYLIAHISSFKLTELVISGRNNSDASLPVGIHYALINRN